MRVAALLVLGVALVCAGTRSAVASSASSCNLNLVAVQAATYQGADGRGYNPYASAAPLTMVQFDLSNRNNQSCNYAIGVSTGSSGSYNRQANGPSGVLRYNVYDSVSPDASPLQDVPDGTSSTMITGTIGPNQGNKSVQLYIDVPPGQFVAPGTYSDQLKISVYSGDSPLSSKVEDTANFAVNIPVPPVVNVDIDAGGVRVPLQGASLVLDFGQLQPRERRSFDLYVQGNTPYRVEIVSQNSGDMLLDQPATNHNKIPYTLSMDGSSQSLNQPVQLSYGSLGQGTQRHTGTITIGNFDAVLGGTYSDVLTITVSAN